MDLHNSQWIFTILNETQRVSDRGFTSEQHKKVIYGGVKHGKRRNNRRIIGK